MELSLKYSFRFPIKLSTVDSLIKISRSHYDAKCREASEPVNGFPSHRDPFLTHWRNMLINDIELNIYDDNHVYGTWKQLDTVLKICEMAHYGMDSELKHELIDLCNYIRSTFVIVCTLSEKWHKEYENVTKQEK